MIIWLFGQPGSGKTTIAKQLLQHIPNSVHLDEVHIREFMQIGNGLDYLTFFEMGKAAVECAVFANSKGGHVIVSMITPISETREYLKKLCPDVKLIYLWYNEWDMRSLNRSYIPEFEYSVQSDTTKMINTSDTNLDACFEIIYRLYKNG